MIVIMDDINVILPIITAGAAIVSSVLTQWMVNRQKRSDFLKEKEWEGLFNIVHDVSEVSIMIDKANDPWDKTDIDYGAVTKCFDSLKENQPYVYMTGKKKLRQSFEKLYSAMEYIDAHKCDVGFETSCRMRVKNLAPLLSDLVKQISQFMGS